MSIRMLRRCRAAVPVALAVAVNSFAGAKPPDLPSASREAVAPQAGSRQVEIGDQDRESKPLEAEQIPVMPTEVEVIRAKPAVVDVDPRLAGARRLYLIGERCRRQGDLDMAVNCYHETHLLCPLSSYGRKASQRLMEIEARRVTEPVLGDAEEQETPRPMPRRRATPPASGSFLQPPLPATDENVIRALEQVLDEFIQPPPRKITIELEEARPAPGTGEEQGPPVVTRPPVLFVPLPPRNLTIYVEEPESY